MSNGRDLLPIILGDVAHTALSRPGVRWAIVSTVLLILLLLFLGTHIYVYQLGWEHRGNAVAAVQVKTEKDLREKLQQQIARNAELSQQYNAEKQGSKVIYRTIRQEVPRVTSNPDGTAAVIPRMPVPPDFVRLWNDALFARLPDATAGAAGAAAGPDPLGDPGPGDIGLDQVLGNHVDNAEQYTECRRQLKALVDWHRANDSS